MHVEKFNYSHMKLILQFLKQFKAVIFKAEYDQNSIHHCVTFPIKIEIKKHESFYSQGLLLFKIWAHITNKNDDEVVKGPLCVTEFQNA